MQKLFTVGIILFSGAMLSSAYAQDIYGSSTTPATSASPSNQVMTNEQFKSRVDSLGKQTKNSISEQVNDQLSSGTSVKAPPLPSPLPSDDTTSSTTQAAPAAMPPAPVTPQPAAAPSSTPPTASSPQGMQPVAAPSSQPYSGFGGGQAKPKSNSSGETKKSGGNWNVGY